MFSRRRRRARPVPGTDAAANVRALIRKAGTARCNHCGFDFLPSAVDVDHVLPIAKGGADEPDNVQILCRPCHKAKTRRDFDHKTLPF